MGKEPKLSLENAGYWYKHRDGYERGNTPILGAVICYAKVGGEAQGKGHVAIVEKINLDGSIVIGESGYKKFRFRTMTLKPPYTYFTGYKVSFIARKWLKRPIKCFLRSMSERKTVSHLPQLEN